MKKIIPILSFVFFIAIVPGFTVGLIDIDDNSSDIKFLKLGSNSNAADLDGVYTVLMYKYSGHESKYLSKRNIGYWVISDDNHNHVLEEYSSDDSYYYIMDRTVFKDGYYLCMAIPKDGGMIYLNDKGKWYKSNDSIEIIKLD